MAKNVPVSKLERTYNVPLRRNFLKTPIHKRAKKAVKVLREFVYKHMKSDNVNIGADVNEHIWRHGIKNPPHHVKVVLTKEDDKVSVVLESNKIKEDAKKSKKEAKKKESKEKLAEAKVVKEKAVKTEEVKEKKPEVIKEEVKKE